MLALFCVTWLQFALWPCTMGLAAAATPVAQAQHASDGAPPCHEHEHDAQNPCKYCLGSTAASGSCADGCAYPHDPQVDSRTTVLSLPPLVAAMFALEIEVSDRARNAWTAVDRPPASPGALTTRYCRYLE